MSEALRVIIVRLSALGDATMLLPAAVTLQKSIPQAEITWLIGRAAHGLLEGVPGIRFIVVDKPGSVRDFLRIKKILAGMDFDVLLAMQATLRANLIYPMIRAKRRIGFDRERARCGQWLFTTESIPFRREHIMDSFFAFAEALGARERRLEWPLCIPEADKVWVQELFPGPAPVLAINPSSSKAERDWPVGRLLETAEKAIKTWNVRLAIVGDGSAKASALGKLIEAALPCVNLVGKTTQKSLAALLGRADCLLSPDSGPVHVARAMGTPVVGLYAVAPSALSGPYGAAEFTVDRYAEALRLILRKDPDLVPWGTRVHKDSAMSLIQAEDVLERLAAVFAMKKRAKN